MDFQFAKQRITGVVRIGFEQADDAFLADILTFLVAVMEQADAVWVEL